MKDSIKKKLIIIGVALSAIFLVSCGNQKGQETPSSEIHQVTQESASTAYDGNYPFHEPYGQGMGVVPGRVVWNYNKDSVKWDDEEAWWQPDHFNRQVILNMVNESIAALGNADTPKESWQRLFEENKKNRNMTGSYLSGEKIAIKANINGSGVMDDDNSGNTNMSYTNPVLLYALLTSLVEEAGVAPEDITVYDVSRLFPL